MIATVKLPRLGETADEAEIVEWLCEVGQVVREGDVLASVETDKVVSELPSPVSGTIIEILIPVDLEIEVGTALLRIEVA